jgi:hypothetical protein
MRPTLVAMAHPDCRRRIHHGNVGGVLFASAETASADTAAA